MPIISPTVSNAHAVESIATNASIVLGTASIRVPNKHTAWKMIVSNSVLVAVAKIATVIGGIEETRSGLRISSKVPASSTRVSLVTSRLNSTYQGALVRGFMIALSAPRLVGCFVKMTTGAAEGP